MPPPLAGEVCQGWHPEASERVLHTELEPLAPSLESISQGIPTRALQLVDVWTSAGFPEQNLMVTLGSYCSRLDPRP